MQSSDLLAGLNERQHQAVTASGGPLVVLAGAGSGKTRVLTRRIAYRIVEGETDPSKVLALTFTRKAASEFRRRLQANGLRDDVVAGTFHGVALTQLRARWAERGIEPPTMLERKFTFIAQLLGRRRGVEPLDVVNEIEWARARLVAPDDYGNAAEAAGRTPPIPPDDMAELMVRFQQEKRQRRVVDFDDLLTLAIRDLRADPDYAAGVRWRHRHLYVDEFQDVNPLQFELLRQWRGDSDDLFVVGDPNQAIYGWNGADPFLLADFAKRERSATVIDLRDNYRSTPQILTLASAALAGKSGQLVPHRADGAVPTLTAYPSDLSEAAGIARAVKTAHHTGAKWADQAVLVRTNAQLVAIEQALVNEGVPVRVKGGAGPLSTPEVRDALRSLARPNIDLPQALTALSEDLAEQSEREETNAEAERRQNVEAFVRLVHDYLAVDPAPSGPGLMAWVATLADGGVDAAGDAVELATFHGAKGLEWPVVHVGGLEKGYVPIGYAKTGAQFAEEQRLLYVAVTRAERELHLSWASERTFGTKVVKRQPSPHLELLQSAIDHLRKGHRPIDWKAEIARSKAKVSSKGKGSKTVERNPVDDPLFDALRAWRMDRARAADVPAYVVFNDQTLRNVAKRRPSTKGQLAGISGIGPAKLERYGDDLLELIRSVPE